MELSQLSDEKIRSIAIPLMDNLMQGSTERDWEKHTADFTAAARESLTEENLLSQCEAYQSSHGQFTHRRLLGITRNPDYVNILWAQEMSKAPGEYMAVLTLVQKDDKPQVIRCWVDLWRPAR